MAAAAATAAAGAADAVMHVLPTVPQDGVPAMLQAVVQATGVAPSHLLHLLLKSPPFKQANGQVEAGGSLESASKYLAVQFHILIHPGSVPCDLAAVLSSLWLPLLRSTDTNLAVLQVEVVDMLSEAVSKRSAWNEVLASIVPLCSYSLNSAISRNSLLSEHILCDSCKQSQEWKAGTLCAVHKPVNVSIACQLLATLLLNAMELFKVPDSRQEVYSHNDAEACPEMLFCKVVHTNFFPLALAMLSQISDRPLRQHAVHKLLPVLLKASNQLYAADCSMEREYPGASAVEQVWLACKSLLSHGVFERYDAFTAVAHLDEFLLVSGCWSGFGASLKLSRKFDIRNDPEFWDFIKLGLVDLDSLTRKRALSVLKQSLLTVPKSTTGNFIQNKEPLVKSPQVLNRREKWAEKEATALGLLVSEEIVLRHADEGCRWDAFFLLYETLEEYGTHLVEATWDLQMSLLLPALEISHVRVGQSHRNGTEASGIKMDISWISALWHRGFDHKNPQVRRLVVKSFLHNSWQYRSALPTLKEDFVLGPFLRMLNDTVQHRDFGVQGVYDTETIRSGSKFIWAYTQNFGERKRTKFVLDLANAMVLLAPCRAGLMAMASCLKAASVGEILDTQSERGCPLFPMVDMTGKRPFQHSGHEFQSLDVLETLKLVAEDSRRHYNPRYRAQVCCHTLQAAFALVTPPAVPFAKVAYFFSSFPRDLLAPGGLMHNYYLSWLRTCEEQCGVAFDPVDWAFDGLLAMAEDFLCPRNSTSAVTYSDDDMLSWGFEGERWARMVTAGVLPVHKQLKLVEYVKQQACKVYHRAYMSALKPEKTLVLLRSLVMECQRSSSAVQEGPFVEAVASALQESFDELVAHAKRAVSIFWEPTEGLSSALPGTVTGKLGGPSQRRLSATMTYHVLQAVVSVTAISDGCLWYSTLMRTAPEPVQRFLWRFAWEVVHLTRVQNESDAELMLGAYETLPAVCGALAAAATPLVVSWGYREIQAASRSFLPDISQPGMIVDELVKALLKGITNLQNSGFLARSRRAVLARFKWCCLDGLLAVPRCAAFTPGNSCGFGGSYPCAVPYSTLWMVFKEALGSLESAGEDYLLPLFRTLRQVLDWGCFEVIEDVYGQSRLQVLWTLVNASWASILDCNKRKVALISAFVSTVLHPAFFKDVAMHSAVDSADIRPLKWLLGRLFEEGKRSPRIMRLTTLHVTGLWLRFPATVIYYIPEIHCLSLHGGENVDEELDGELVSSQVAAKEYLALIQSSDPELAEAFTDSEMYVRVSVAVMVDEFAEMVEKPKDQQAAVSAASNFGRTFLLSLLQATLEDPSLSKELYKKKSAIHRRKVRAWQMLCILSRFVDDDIVLHVISLTHTCLYKNNMPSVRQYMENFAIQIFLRYPDLVQGHLLSYLGDYNFKPQALASYVFIAATVLMFIPCQRLQRSLLQDLFPAILPYMTSHHHNLRSFTQVLIHRLLHHLKVFDLGADFSVDAPGFLGNQLLVTVAGFLDGNSECARIRESVGKILDNYDPAMVRTPRGIFSIRKPELDLGKCVGELPFECVPAAVVDVIADYLSEARDCLRVAMAADAAALLIAENGELENGDVCKDEVQCSGLDDGLPNQFLHSTNTAGYITRSTSLDFQKKINSLRFSGVMGDPNGGHSRHSFDVSAIELEEELLLSNLESRAQEVLNLQGDRQELVVVASLLGLIPNLAGLARTCEVFKVASLVVADTRITLDRQFQVISVTAEQWIPLVEVPEAGVRDFLMQKKKEGFSLLGLEQTANSVSIESYTFPKKAVLVLGKEKQGIPVNLIQALDCCIEIPQFGVIRSLNVHVSGAIAVWEYTRQHSKQSKVVGD